MRLTCIPSERAANGCGHKVAKGSAPKLREGVQAPVAVRVDGPVVSRCLEIPSWGPVEYTTGGEIRWAESLVLYYSLTCISLEWPPLALDSPLSGQPQRDLTLENYF